MLVRADEGLVERQLRRLVTASFQQSRTVRSHCAHSRSSTLSSLDTTYLHLADDGRRTRRHDRVPA